MCSVVQFPFSVPIYFCYFSPLLGIVLFALVSTRKRPTNKIVLGAVATFYILFAVLQVVPRALYINPPAFFSPVTLPIGPLRMERGGGVEYYVPEMYEVLVSTVREHATNGKLVATPECPEVYFLTGLENPGHNDNVVTSDELLRAVSGGGVSVVVLNLYSNFSGETLTPEMFRTLGLLPAELGRHRQVPGVLPVVGTAIRFGKREVSVAWRRSDGFRCLLLQLMGEIPPILVLVLTRWGGG